MESPEQHRLDEYFKAVNSQRLTVSYEEVRRSFIDQLSSSPTLENTTNRVGSSSSDLKAFFEQKINIVYTLIGIVLIASLVWAYFTRKMEEKVPEQQSIEQEVPKVEEQTEKEKIGISDPGIPVESSSLEMVIETEKEKKPLKEPLSAIEDSIRDHLTVDTSFTLPDSSNDVVIEGKSVLKHKKKSDEVKPPFRYQFTPNTPERELRKLQEDLKKEGVELIFETLKYKKGVIYKVEGTIELEGYFGTFTTDEFEDFTFKWKYTRSKAGNPDGFDIIINTPMKRKSNTAVQIDEIE